MATNFFMAAAKFNEDAAKFQGHNYCDTILSILFVNTRWI